jgi:hypothetical protein
LLNNGLISEKAKTVVIVLTFMERLLACRGHGWIGWI